MAHKQLELQLTGVYTDAFTLARTLDDWFQIFYLNSPFLNPISVKIEELIGTGFDTKTHLRNVSEAHQFIFALLK